mmetsp:Transcript_30878/g.71753  ORF Transcript_30878/g.71753 Transcript_30878/m.71753 type:complete len:212 (+) Transcript_30878:149-784(+)
MAISLGREGAGVMAMWLSEVSQLATTMAPSRFGRCNLQRTGSWCTRCAGSLPSRRRRSLLCARCSPSATRHARGWRTSLSCRAAWCCASANPNLRAYPRLRTSRLSHCHTAAAAAAARTQLDAHGSLACRCGYLPLQAASTCVSSRRHPRRRSLPDALPGSSCYARLPPARRPSPALRRCRLRALSSAWSARGWCCGLRSCCTATLPCLTT